MAAGFITKALAALPLLSPRWVEFANGDQAPAHGAIQIDPATGLPLDFATGPSLSVVLGSSAATTNSNAIKTSPGYLHRIDGYNARASFVCLRLFNNTSPDAASQTTKKRLYLPPTALFSFVWPNPYYFSTGIGYGLTTDSGVTSSNAVAAGDILDLNFDYS